MQLRVDSIIGKLEIFIRSSVLLQVEPVPLTLKTTKLRFDKSGSLLILRNQARNSRQSACHSGSSKFTWVDMFIF